MSFQFVQLIQLAVYAILGVLAYKIKNTAFRIAMVLIALILFTINPIRFEQEGMSKIERTKNITIVELPERVNVDKKTFSEQQQAEMKNLKAESKEITENETK